MTLSAGDKLGSYEILGLIGAGGMGEVYRAQDLRLRREVAIKVSAARFSDRFEREARAVAALNHPNVCTLYDVGPNYLVMELVIGESPKGPLPLDDAIRIAKQIADALNEAHEKGIVHRDLKPANIKIKEDGTVKVLDFGLAKVSELETPSAAEASTTSPAATQTGTILGTAGYMSPEQACGRPVDKRADIWAFGVVLHEMLTGRRLFAGESAAEAVAKVIESEPSWVGIQPQVQRLLKKCLEKDPKRRLRDIGDVWELLEFGDRVRTPPRTMRAWIAVAVLLAALGVASWSAWPRLQPEDRTLVRLNVDLGAEVSLPSPQNSLGSVIISPNGAQLVFASGTPSKLFTRKLDQVATMQLPGTEGAQYPFFSPDGQWVGFFVGSKLNKISVEGGRVIGIGDGFAASGASWGPNEVIVAGGQLRGGLVQISSNGGPVTNLTEARQGEFVHAMPQILPGGKAVLFAVHGEGGNDAIDQATVEIVNLNDRRRKVLVRGGTAPRYVETAPGTGHLLYENRSTLFAIPFNLERLEPYGTAVAVASDLAYHPSGVGHFDVSRTGTLVYRRSEAGSNASVNDLLNVVPDSTIQWLTPGPGGAIRKEPLISKPGPYVTVSLAPDGKRLAMVISESKHAALSVHDLLRDVMTHFAFSADVFNPIWTPDSKYLLFSSADGIFWAHADGSGQPQPLILKSAQSAWSVNGGRLAYTQLEADSVPRIWTVSLQEEGGRLKAEKPEQFLQSEGGMEPAFSPDGRWLLYQSTDDTPQIFVRPFPRPASGEGIRIQVSNKGGVHPVWSPNSHDILYQAQDQIMAVNYKERSGEFIPELPHVWVAHLGGDDLRWTLDPNEGRVAIVTPPPSTPHAPKPQVSADHSVIFVQYFFDELRRRVPLKK